MPIDYSNIFFIIHHGADLGAGSGLATVEAGRHQLDHLGICLHREHLFNELDHFVGVELDAHRLIYATCELIQVEQVIYKAQEQLRLEEHHHD